IRVPRAGGHRVVCTHRRGLALLSPRVRSPLGLATMRMPPTDAAVLARRAAIIEGLRALVPGEGVIAEPRELRAYETDGLTAYRQVPLAVVLPSTTEEVAAVLRYCRDEKVKVVPRGAGTSLSGGALPLADGIVLGLGKFNRILEIDVANR